MHRHPHLFEVNAAVLVDRMARHAGDNRMSLARIPGEYWMYLQALGFDFVWLMGAWRRSPRARQLALEIPELRRAYDQIIPGWRDEDVLGSPYAIHGYTLEPRLGEARDLPVLRARLNALGLGLMLDFVPNHLAMDHPWTLQHPDRFVRADAARAGLSPASYFRAGDSNWLAHGRDPNFPPWCDTAQVNFFSRDMRRALTEEVMEIAARADGVRCDMAMLGLNAVFERTWGDHLDGLERPDIEFWAELIGRVKQRHPGFVFLAESYWGLEDDLERLGFDFTYDKRFYDLLRNAFAPEIAAWLASGPASHPRSMRFIENHDEPRAVDAMGRERAMLSAVMLLTLPGMRFVQDGQMEGRRVKIPVQIGREPDEEADTEMAALYRRLLEITRAEVYHRGEWSAGRALPVWEGNTSSSNVIAWYWQWGHETRIVTVNYSAHPAQARLKIPFLPGEGSAFRFYDELGGETYVRAAEELQGPGLYIALPPWKAHILSGPQVV